MMTWVWLVLSQVSTPVGPPAPHPPSAWVAVGWREGEAVREGFVNPVWVAEPEPSEETAAAIRQEDPQASVVVARPRMRVWRVRDAAAARRAVPRLVVVVHDLPSTASRVQVPVGLLCDGGRGEDVRGLAALERSRETGCAPNMWFVGATK